MSKSEIRLSAQLHVIAARGPFEDYLGDCIAWSEDHQMRPEGSALIENAPDWIAPWAKKHLKGGAKRAAPSPFHYEYEMGDYEGIFIVMPQEKRLSEKAAGQLLELAGISSSYTKDKTLKNGGVRYASNAKFCGRTSLLTRTSKMGCMSWNLPAGPPSLRGTCPGAIIGWRRVGMDPGKDVAVNKSLLVGTNPDGSTRTREWNDVPYLWHDSYKLVGDMAMSEDDADSSDMHDKSKYSGREFVFRGKPDLQWLQQKDYEVQDSIKELQDHLDIEKIPVNLDKKRTANVLAADGTVVQMEVSPFNYICNGCYALKGSYGNPSTIFGMSMKKLWMQWCLEHNPEEFVQVMCIAIESARRANTKRREAKRGAPPARSTIAEEQVLQFPDPDYFRIHDSGDFFQARYLDLWLRIIDTFPEVKFWAPTRLWFSATSTKSFQRIIKRRQKEGKPGLPANLMIRPSALHFGDNPPSLRALTGHDAGSGAADPEKFLNGALCADSRGMTEWICPAYRPFTEEGGGALLAVDKEGKVVPGKYEKSGSCQFALGLTKPKCGAKRKQGCRVCWDMPEVHVVYKEH